MAVDSLPAFDPRTVETLRRAARSGDQRTAVRGAAQQFEALMLQQLLKAMRATVPEQTLLDSSERKMWQELSDQQLASDLAKSGGVGLAKALERQWLPAQPGAETTATSGASSASATDTVGAEANPQFQAPVLERSFLRAETAVEEAATALAPVAERSFTASPTLWQRLTHQEASLAPASATAEAPPPATAPSPAERGAERTEAAFPIRLRDAAAELTLSSGLVAKEAGEGRIERFVRQLLPAAQEASAALGVPPHFLLAHAALETGWGSAMLRRADGTPTHNLFNIKAGSGWKGETVAVRTTEYRRGRPQSEVARFRVYPDLQSAFQDYVRLLSTSDRYAAARQAKTPEQFAKALARGGYATDPHYAQKLLRVLHNPRFQTALVQGSGTKVA
jgi:flagellar protein FlgJ